jgi:hypothetical protein
VIAVAIRSSRRLIGSPLLVDQILSSASSATVTFAALLFLNLSAFGAFSLGAVCQSVAINATRTGILEWQVLDQSALPGEISGAPRSAVRTAAAIFGPALAILLLGISVLSRFLSLSEAALFLFVTVVSIFVDLERFRAFASNRLRSAICIDMAWLILSLLGLLILHLSHTHISIEALLIAYGFAGLASLVLFPSIINIEMGIGVLREARRTLVRRILFCGEFFVNIAGGTFLLFLITWISGIQVAGIYRAVLTLYFPFETLQYAIRMRFIRNGDWTQSGAANTSRRAAILYGGVGILYVVGLLALSAAGVIRRFPSLSATDIYTILAGGISEVAWGVAQATYDFGRTRNRLSTVVLMRTFQTTLLLGAGSLACAAWRADGIFAVRTIAFALPALVAVRIFQLQVTRNHTSSN